MFDHTGKFITFSTVFKVYKKKGTGIMFCVVFGTRRMHAYAGCSVEERDLVQ